jgi:hypothetical protein
MYVNCSRYLYFLKKKTRMNKIDKIKNWILNLPICIQKTNPWWENGSCLSPHINTVSFNQFIINYDQGRPDL